MGVVDHGGPYDGPQFVHLRCFCTFVFVSISISIPPFHFASLRPLPTLDFGSRLRTFFALRRSIRSRHLLTTAQAVHCRSLARPIVRAIAWGLCLEQTIHSLPTCRARPLSLRIADWLKEPHWTTPNLPSVQRTTSSAIASCFTRTPNNTTFVVQNLTLVDRITLTARLTTSRYVIRPGSSAT